MLVKTLIVAVLLIQTGCLYFARYDGPYRGRVVEERTREPIEGVVVKGEWSVYHHGLAGGYTTFYDSREAVTDKDGEFLIPGQGLRIMTSIGPMEALIYKAGYTYYQAGWDTLKTGLFTKEEVKWEGDMPIFPIKKLTDHERKADRSSTTIPTPGSGNAPLMTNEIDKEIKFRWEP